MTNQAGYAGQIFRGVDYSPTWPNWSQGPGNTQTNDSDFANDAFQSLWSNEYIGAPTGDPSAPVNNKPNYRNDLGTIAANGFNLVRLYNWDMARGTTYNESSSAGLDHINFLHVANSLGLKVVVPVSDYFISDDAYAWNGLPQPGDYDFASAPAAIQTDFTQFIASITDPATGAIHAAILAIAVGNEGDIGEGISSPPTTPSNFLYRTLWWIINLRQTISPGTLLTATFSNGDQGLGIGSWFECVVNGVTASQATPTKWNNYTQFSAAVPGLAVTDSNYTAYYFNSVNISQVNPANNTNSLSQTLALYDSPTPKQPWPGMVSTVPLLLMELFTPNRGNFTPPGNQATAAVNQVKTLEQYLAAHGGTTWLMGYNYFEFNDEPALPKQTGLYEYASNSPPSAATGTTSVFYPPGSFPSYNFPVAALTPAPGPTGGSNPLIVAIAELFPIAGTLMPIGGTAGLWEAQFTSPQALPIWVQNGMTVIGPNIPANSVVSTAPYPPGSADSLILTCASAQPLNPFPIGPISISFTG